MAVYTEIGDDELTVFVAAYDVGEVLSCKGIAEGVENSNYLLSTERGRFILTLYERRVDPEDLPYFLGLMDHLARRGVPCPVPVAARDGAALRRLAGRPAAMVTFLEGVWPKKPTPDHCAALGAALAELHRAGADYGLRRANALSIAAWPGLLGACGAAADTVRPGLGALLGDEMAFLEAAWPRGLPAGVIHGDLFPDNVFFRQGAVTGIIDFYFACEDALAYDLAICINAWCFEDHRVFNATKARRLVEGYRTVRPLAPAELDALPILARGAAVRFLLTRLYDWAYTPKDALVTRKDPREFLERLTFHRAARGVGDYGIRVAA